MSRPVALITATLIVVASALVAVAVAFTPAPPDMKPFVAPQPPSVPIPWADKPAGEKADDVATLASDLGRKLCDDEALRGATGETNFTAPGGWVIHCRSGALVIINHDLESLD